MSTPTELMSEDASDRTPAAWRGLGHPEGGKAIDMLATAMEVRRK